MDYDKLITKAIVVIPEHYRLEMEDNTPKGRELVRSLIWRDLEKTDCKIEIALDLETGHLLRLDIDMDSQDAVGYDSSAEEARAAPSGYGLRYYPGQRFERQPVSIGKIRTKSCT